MWEGLWACTPSGNYFVLTSDLLKQGPLGLSSQSVLSSLLCLCFQSSSRPLLLDKLPRARGQVHSEATPWEWKRRGREHGGKLPLSMEQCQRKEWERSRGVEHPTHRSLLKHSSPRPEISRMGVAARLLVNPYLTEVAPTACIWKKPSAPRRSILYLQDSLSSQLLPALPARPTNCCPFPVISGPSNEADPKHRPCKQSPHPVIHTVPGLPLHRCGWPHKVQRKGFSSPYWRTEKGGPASVRD